MLSSPRRGSEDRGRTTENGRTLHASRLAGQLHASRLRLKRFEKTSFASNASGDLSGQAYRPTTGCLTEGRRQKDREQIDPFSDFRRPTSGNRMRFLFTMSDIGGRRTDDRGQSLWSAAPAFLTPRRAQRRAPKAKLICIGTRARARTYPSSAVRPLSSEDGGARRDRTDDLMLAKHALSQLSYGPVRKQRTDSRSATFRRLSSVVRSWWAWEDLNLRPHAYQARALTN